MADVEGWGSDAELDIGEDGENEGAVVGHSDTFFRIQESADTVITEAPPDDYEEKAIDISGGLQEDTIDLRKRLESLEEQLKEERALRKQLEAVEQELKEEKAARETEKAEMHDRMETFKQKTKDHVKQIQEKMQQVVQTKDARISELEDNLASAKGPAHDLATTEELTAVRKELEETKAELSDKSAKLDEAKKSLEGPLATAKELEDLKALLKSKEQELQVAEEARIAYQTACLEAQNQRKIALEELSELQKRLEEWERRGEGAGSAEEKVAASELLVANQRLQQLELDLETARKEAAAAQERADQELQAAKNEANAATEQAEDAKRKVNEMVEQRKLAGETDLAESRQLELRNAELEAQLQATTKDLERLQAEIKVFEGQEAARDATAESQRKELSLANSELEAKLTAAQCELERCKAELATTIAATAEGEKAAAVEGVEDTDKAEENDELIALRAELETLRTEAASSKAALEAKLSEVVRKAKEHVKQVQSRLEVSSAENKELIERARELEESLASQQEKVSRYQQLMREAKTRLDDQEAKERELQTALDEEKAKATSLQEQVGSVTKEFSVPPSKDIIASRGGVSVAVEVEDEIWCFVPAEKKPTTELELVDAEDTQKSGTWWLRNQLDLEEAPVPLQRKWKGEVSALRAQLGRAKRRAEEVEESFETYKAKASAALNSNASQAEVVHRQEREIEDLGQKVHGLELAHRRLEGERDRAYEESADVKKRLSEVQRELREWERTSERTTREWEEKLDVKIETLTKTHLAEKAELEKAWRDKERELRKELDIKQSIKESLEEEVDKLRTMLSSKATTSTSIPEPPVEVEKPESVAGSSVQKAPSRLATPVLTPRAETPEAKASEAPTLVEPQQQVTPSNSQTEDAAPPSNLPPQAYSLHTSVAWQDLVALRGQVRALETQLYEEQGRCNEIRKEKEDLQRELQESAQQQRLQDTVGQHQQMEYIRNVFKRFIDLLPVGAKEQEQLIPVLMTFFQFPPEETRLIVHHRATTSGPGLLGRLGWRG